MAYLVEIRCQRSMTVLPFQVMVEEKNQGNVIIQIDSKHCNLEMNSFVEIDFTVTKET